MRMVTKSDQSVSPVKEIQAGNTTDLAVNASAQTPSTSTSSVSNVMESSDAGQSNVGSDQVSSVVGPTELVLNNTINKGLTDRTITIALVAVGGLAAIYLLRARGHSKGGH